MGQDCSVSMSEVISTLLLRSRIVTARDIVNLYNRISSLYDIEVVDDDIAHLFDCIKMDKDSNFSLKDGFDYDSILNNGMTVREFLIDNGLPDDVRKVIYPEMLGRDSIKRDVSCINNSFFTGNLLIRVKKFKERKRVKGLFCFDGKA